MCDHLGLFGVLGADGCSGYPWDRLAFPLCAAAAFGVLAGLWVEVVPVAGGATFVGVYPPQCDLLCVCVCVLLALCACVHPR